MADTTPKRIEDFAPTTLNDIIGQQSAKAQVATALAAARADKKPFDSALLVGPSGLGKTTLAQVIANEMGTGYYEVLGQSITNPAGLHDLLLRAKDHDVVHLDECHELKDTFQTALYHALDQRILSVGGKHGSPHTIPIADFTLLLSTTEEHLMLQPLRNRMRLTLRFEYYSEAELIEVLRRRIAGLRWKVDKQVLLPIAQRSQATARLAVNLLRSCRRVCRADDETAITMAHLSRACELERIDGLGLGPTEQDYLRLLVEGPLRLNVLAIRLGQAIRTISQVTEPFLLRAGLITKDGQGIRILTPKGHKHVAACLIPV